MASCLQVRSEVEGPYAVPATDALCFPTTSPPRSKLTGGRYFERLLTRFSVPEELFGPLSMRGASTAGGGVLCCCHRAWALAF